MTEPIDTPVEPAEEVLPKILRVNRRINGKMWLAGVGPRTARIMFVTTCVLEEEAKEEKPIGYGRTVPRIPRMLECPQGVILKDVALRNGIDLDKCFYTSIVRYLPDNLSHRTKPTKGMLDICMPLLAADIKEIRPDIIVCLGKLTFDQFVNFKAKDSDIYGAWFYNERFKCKIYPMPSIHWMLKAEKHERFCMDFTSVRKMYDAINGITIPAFPTEYHTIHNSDELRMLMLKLEMENRTVLSVDCEWEGQQHVDGKLRSLQICWEAGKAAYIRFMDDELNYVFDVPYAEAGAIMAPWCNRKDVHYIGHHVSADLSWMSYWLGLDWYNKAIFDTEFALQCCDESLDLGLDALALRFTDLGKYDWDLIWYRKQHPERRGNGYGLVPDDILIDYAMKDVDCVMRSYPIILAWMERQKLTGYYDNILNPFVTNVFTSFCLNGIPIDRARMDEMRDLYGWANGELQKDFQKLISDEAEKFLAAKLFRDFDMEGLKCFDAVMELAATGKVGEIKKLIKDTVGAEKLMDYEPYVEHFLIAPQFNIRSKPQMQRWLFDVKRYTPVKSTSNKAAGMPSISWDKVLEYPESKQKLFTPSSDAQSLKILAAKHKDDVLESLLELNAVGNICKAFLKEATIDEETGELTRENGLHYWIASDDAIHLMHSCTETGRARSWNPNCLNWPSWVHAKLGAGMVHIIASRAALGQLPKHLQKYVGLAGKKFPTIRSVMSAKPGWCIVEADYQTAEMRGLAYISGDRDLIDLIEKPDGMFARVKPEFIPDGVEEEDCVCRLSYPDFVTNPPNKEDYIMTYTVGGVVIAKFAQHMLLRDAYGNIMSPKYDMHWGVVELARSTCREVLDKKRDRGAGKVVNFCVAGSTQVLTDSGYKAITAVTKSDHLWDGYAWVTHGGVVSRGEKLVMTYDGITGTPDHTVFTAQGKVTLMDAQFMQIPITRSSEGFFALIDAPNEPMVGYDLHARRAEIQALCEDEQACISHSLRREPVYDIVDAGPYNRFTANERLISNSSSYGGQAASIARKIESDTGIAPDIEDVQCMLDAIERRQPRATAYFQECERIPEESGMFKAESGRIRHCHTLASGISGLSARTRNGQITALGRECRNAPMQESVGSTAARACSSMLDFGLATGLKGYSCVCLYDSIVVHCPVYERAIWLKALRLYMHLANGWRYNDRILRYPIDAELNGGWSTKASAELHKHLHDPSWEPTPENLKPLEDWLDSESKKYESNPELSVYVNVSADRSETLAL